ncbi:anthranilate synthase component I [uncultured Sphaerochaeta sp.]|uniref:anthranilate synthase component I n=1 Tax=uncultured Sphaerochaeta sp. TaxID=886478 RepID=UPI002A0A5E6A|nr:anthranilate synthase component I [uncultured Sphaerochaeta sp.]
MYSLTLDQAKTIASTNEGDLIPITTELFSDRHTPITVLETLKETSSHCYLLESVDDRQKWGRYSFLGFNPSMEITCVDHCLTITDERGITTLKTSTPSQEIRSILQKHRSIILPSLPPFTGGLVGYFSYDYFKYSEPSLILDAEDNEQFKDVDLMLFDKVICFDNYRQKIILIANMQTKDLETGYQKAILQLEALKNLITSKMATTHQTGRLLGPMENLFDEETYCTMVEKAKNHIYEGDIFQVVLSNRLSAPFEGSLLDTYRYLRTTNPSPYMFYFSGCDVEIAGASPETLVNLQEGILHTFPLAGTRPRGKNELEDAQLEKELLCDEKELAEHNMLVDLGRNDLGKISEFGSVVVEKYLTVEHFSHVMHIGSTVRGMLKQGKDALDAIEAILPAGTLSGAPKLRACEIINTLENNKRGIYGGAIGYIAFSGNMDTCIAIRIAYKKNGKVFVRSGAGIVADSNPKSEYQECINKAKAVTEAIEAVSGGLQ